MIRDDADLALVREQLDRAEHALRSLEAEVRPINEARFFLWAESYIGMINQLRGEIDEYAARQRVQALPTFEPTATALGTRTAQGS